MKTCSCVMPDDVNGEATSRGLADNRFKWQPGQRITVGFLDGSPALCRRVITVAREWLRYANLDMRFSWVTPVRPELLTTNIQITFRRGASWSYIGKECLSRPNGSPTMQFGWLDERTDNGEFQRVVLHEFGHALGLLHEHNNPVGGVVWNRPAALAYYKQANGWDEYTVQQNVFATYEKEWRAGLVRSSGFDPQSIMLYPIPTGLANISVGWNNGLSTGDIALVRALYPRK